MSIHVNTHNDNNNYHASLLEKVNAYKIKKKVNVSVDLTQRKKNNNLLSQKKTINF